MLSIFSPLSFLIFWGGGLLLNKRILQIGNFIYLLFLLSLWLYVYSAIINSSLQGVFSMLHLMVYSCVLIAIKTKSIILFYIFFELSVLPISLIVFLYGYQPEKLQAVLTLLLYTIVRRFPLLIYIIKDVHTLTSSFLMTIPMTLRFLVKTPMYLFHTWLPKAHVEAPVGGSMVLAGVLLKLGSYGLLLFLPLVKSNILISGYIGISLVGSLIASAICMRQGDLKILIAYSSVVHMTVVTLGFLRGRELGQACGLMIVLRHGLCSPMLFAYRFWLYETSHSRLITNNSCNWPLMMAGFLGLVSLNIGVPPRLRLWAEVLMAMSFISILRRSFPFLLLIFFFGAAFNLFLYTSCMHCKFNASFRSFSYKHLYPLNQTLFLGYGSFLCLDLFHLSIDFSL